MFSDGDDFETPAAHAARQQANVEEKEGKIVWTEKVETSYPLIPAHCLVCTKKESSVL